MASSLSGPLPSLAVFGPQSKIPTDAYLSELRTYIRGKPFLNLLSKPSEICHWSGRLICHCIKHWVSRGRSEIFADDFGLALPMSLVIHLAQYFMYLEQKKVTHSELMQSFQKGAGIQGYCGGMFAAVSVACANNEEEVIFNACRAIRLAVGTHISAITDPKTLSLVGPPEVLLRVEKFAREQKLAVHLIPLRGKMHNPDNAELAKDLANFCDAHEQLKIPDASRLFVPLRSNITANVMKEGSLSLEIARVILADKCDWYQLLIETAKDLSKTGQSQHMLAAFGIGDCVSLQPYFQASLKMEKLDMFTQLQNVSHPTNSPQPPSVEFPASTIAVVGMACRFPGVNTVEELWEVINSGRSIVQEVPKERISFQDTCRFRSDQRWASKQKFYGGFISDHDCFDNAFFNVAYQAVESSGYLTSSQSRDAGDRVGVFIGASFDDYLEHTSASTPFSYTATGTLRAFLRGKISHYFGCTGLSEVIDTACSSSLVAISHGVRALQRNECETALVGVNFMSTATHFLGLGRAGSSVQQANIFGVIPGISTNQGSDPKSITVPSATSQVQFFNSVFQEAAIEPSLITYVEAHGSVKANIGHAETSAGIAGVIKALLVLNKGILPPLANFKCLNPRTPALEADKIVISKTSQTWNVLFRGIMVNGYGASGSNAALLLCQSPRKIEKLTSEVEGTPSFPIILTAASKTSLQMYAKSLKNHLETPEGSYKNIGHVALTLSKHRKLHRFAFTTTANDIRSWIDPGLKVDAVVGHSFGELTAMAVSGVLSFEGAINIIRARAKSIQVKWDPEAGAMLVIHDTQEAIRKVLAHLAIGSEKVEIACYNGPTSHVLVGTSASIAEVENILHTEPKFSSLRSSKVNITHGFHSRSTDGLLSDLGAIAKQQTFSTPNIPIEACTGEKSAPISFDASRSNCENLSFSIMLSGFHLMHLSVPPIGYHMWTQSKTHSAPSSCNSGYQSRSVAAEVGPLSLVNFCFGRDKQFSIGTNTERFQSIVNGHNVIGNSLCPAALYLEAAIMAAESAMGSLEKHGLSFWDFRIDAPLGIDHRRKVLITLEGNVEGQDWSFVLTSSVAGQPSFKPTIHAKACFKFVTAQSGQELRQFQYQQRFAKARLAAFLLNPDTETIRMSRAYRLFSRVVNYPSILKGISSLTIAGNEALAELELPAALKTDESSAVRSCDTIALDNFVQVIGLLMNTSDICTENEAFLAIGADNISILPVCELESVRKYRVFASFTSDGGAKAIVDIFVLTADSVLAAVITGMHLSKIPLHTIQKILAPASETKSQMAEVLRMPQAIQVTKPTATATENTDPPSSPMSTNDEESPKTVQYSAASEVRLKKVISEFAGIGDLSVDSLAAIELVAGLQSLFGIELSSTDITTTTISALAVLSVACSTEPASIKTSTR
ncbi:Non-reducing polyketide synthase [Lachnellula occidentalis]|uniref:Non-reducing polyketide synthase n=1 Tax=Lachnellula occidentalis TaxID=215460 RepID=A0A8H8S5G4_9HELO|nr:Non-reducing polyketide synthase [Lachnellula occidentalis]